MPEPTGGGRAWNNEKTCWLQMEFEPLAPLRARWPAVAVVGANDLTLDLSQETKK